MLQNAVKLTREEFERQKSELRQIEQSYNEWERSLDEYEESINTLEAALDSEGITQRMSELQRAYHDLKVMQQTQGTVVDPTLLATAKARLEIFKELIERLKPSGAQVN